MSRMMSITALCLASLLPSFGNAADVHRKDSLRGDYAYRLAVSCLSSSVGFAGLAVLAGDAQCLFLLPRRLERRPVQRWRHRGRLQRPGARALPLLAPRGLPVSCTGLGLARLQVRKKCQRMDMHFCWIQPRNGNVDNDGS